jgi:CMP-N-acetylneuraminic acid synthetase
MRVLGLIPARGGSKGIPNKNIRLLCGKPLLAYTAEAALHAQSLERVILSTDSEAIAKVGEEWGLEVPFMRPANLAKDDTPTLAVVQHAIQWIEAQGQIYDAICLLQPTNPLRTTSDIDACVSLLAQSSADSVISVLSVPSEYNPHWVYFADSEGYLTLTTGEKQPIARRQDLPPAFHRSGSVYITRWSVARDVDLYGAKVIGYPVTPERHVNIDTQSDWQLAERFINALQHSDE